ncbi:MAG TPA: radical SAM protein [Urbifossiella sp.]|nr:radical SAM protein [Urbifossiella sp.]
MTGFEPRPLPLAAPDSLLPEVLHVEVTTACNLACVFCKNAEPAVRARGELPLPVFVDLLDQLGDHCRRVNLWGTGEPLLYPPTLEMTRRAAARGVPNIKISTNGTLLSDSMVGQLLASGVTSVRVALDSADPTEYRALRGGSWARAVAGIERLVVARDRIGAPVRVVVASVVTGQSPESLRRVRALAAELGADDHELMPNIWAGQFPVAGRRPPPERCDQPLRTIHVLADGDVVPCCHSLTGEVVLGNIHRESLRDIWAGAAARRARDEFTGARFPLCGGCNFGVRLDPDGRPIG